MKPFNEDTVEFRIHELRHHYLSHRLEPKILYIGRKTMMDFKDQMEPSMMHRMTREDRPPEYMGMRVVEVYQDEWLTVGVEEL